MNEQQWEEIRIEDVKPGDVARCNGREFTVDECSCEPYKWSMKIGATTFVPYEPEFFEIIGITFHRKVKREPRTFVGKINCLEFDGQMKVVPDCILLSCSWPYGTRVRVTEILDGEDGS